jgi:hypothetical protein
MQPNALIAATGIGLVLQLAMVVGGHFAPAVRELFALGGMGFSLVAGLLYVWLGVQGSWRADLIGGAVAGGACALIGIALSAVLGDVPAMLLLFGTLSSIVTGAMGGAVGKLVFG